MNKRVLIAVYCIVIAVTVLLGTSCKNSSDTVMNGNPGGAPMASNPQVDLKGNMGGAPMSANKHLNPPGEETAKSENKSTELSGRMGGAAMMHKGPRNSNALKNEKSLVSPTASAPGSK